MGRAFRVIVGGAWPVVRSRLAAICPASRWRSWIDPDGLRQRDGLLMDQAIREENRCGVVDVTS